MSLAGNKRNLFTTIGSFNSMQQQGNLPNLRNTFSSVNNKNEPIPFLLDVLKVVKGGDALMGLIGELFINFVDEVNPKANDVIKNQTIQGNAGDRLPQAFRSSGNGYDIPVKDIDLFGKLKTNPNSANGSLLYSDNVDTFDKKAYNALSNPGTFVQYNNLLIRYNENFDTFTVKASTNDGSIGDWTSGYIDGIKLIDKRETLTVAMDLMFGTITKNQKKSEQEILNELKINALINKLSTEDEELTLNSDELIDLENRSRDLQQGIQTYDFGCGLMGVSLNFDDFNRVINNVQTSNDPFLIGNEINGAIANAFEGNSSMYDSNQETIRDGFFSRLINGLYLIFIRSMSLTPQVRILMGIVSAFQNNGVSTLSADFSVDIQNMKIFYKCVIKELVKMLSEFIFTMIVVALVALLKPIVREIINEKINSYVGVLRSLIGSKL